MCVHVFCFVNLSLFAFEPEVDGEEECDDDDNDDGDESADGVQGNDDLLPMALLGLISF